MRAAVYVIYLAVAIPVTVIISCVAYLIRIPCSYLTALARVLIFRPAWLLDPKCGPQAPPGSDPAVLQYFYGPAMADAARAAWIAFDDCRRHWRSGINSALRPSRTSRSPVNGPLSIASATGMTAGTFFGGLAAACFMLLHFLIVSLSAALVWALCTILRGVDSAALRARDARITCPACSELVSYPGYFCPGNGCRRRHHDLLPGKFGIFRRRCHCGTSLRNSPLSAFYEIAAFCPHCAQPLERQPGEHTEIVLPVFGPPGPTTARLLLRMVTQLRKWDSDGQLTAVLADSADTREPDVPGQLPRVYSIRLTANANTRILRMFDAADEPPPSARSARRLNKARTIVFVIGDRPAGASPYQAYGQARRGMAEMGFAARETRLAFVVTGGALTDASSRRASRWIRELGLRDLVRSVRHDFKAWHFFRAPELVQDEVLHESAAPLVRWLLKGEGISPAPCRVVTDVSAAQERSYQWHRRYVFAAVAASAVLLALLFIT